MLNLSCEARTQARSENGPNLEPVRPSENFACRIKEANEYLGYIAWSDVYMSINKPKEAEEVLIDLTQHFPRFPHAYLKLWDFRFRRGKFVESIDPIEELFVKIGDFHTIPEIRIALVPLLYAKNLYKIDQHVFAFELLQNEFCKRPVYTVFLYFLAKFAVLSEHQNFKGTAIGILQECLRSCVSQRKAKILYLLGIAYKEIGQPLEAFDLFEKSLEYYK